MFAVNLLNRALILVAALALIAMVVHIGADVAGRYLFNSPLFGTLEIVTYYYMTAVTLLPLAATQLAKEHVIVEVFTQKLRASIRNRLDLFAAILTVIYLSVVAWACLIGAINAFKVREYHDLFFFTLSIWPPRWVLFFGILGILVAVIVQLIARDYATSDPDDT